jgi:hypothetical protein
MVEFPKQFERLHIEQPTLRFLVESMNHLDHHSRVERLGHSRVGSIHHRIAELEPSTKGILLHQLEPIRLLVIVELELGSNMSEQDLLVFRPSLDRCWP